jgi:hypothetical protein
MYSVIRELSIVSLCYSACRWVFYVVIVMMFISVIFVPELSMGPFSVTQPNPTHGNLKNLDPTQPKFVPSPKPIELITPKIQVVNLY